MIRSIAVYESVSFDPYYNLAVEQYLLEHLPEDQCILFLWQNQNTVVIGRNQNPWKECRIALLKEEGGHLARRLSGGGAVFHDLGNLNFTFLMPQADFHIDRQLSVIQKAVSYCGLETERSGRNDVLINGRKFSGNAFYKNGKQAYHHGTLLVDVDKDKLGRYLSPSKAKLQSKGVDSVRSRIANLRDFSSEITIPVLKQALVRAFGEVYGAVPKMLANDYLDCAVVDTITQRNQSRQWLFGAKIPFSITFEGRFSWGELQLCLDVNNGNIERVKVYTDSMDWTFSSKMEEMLVGCAFDQENIRSCLLGHESSELNELIEPLCDALF